MSISTKEAGRKGAQVRNSKYSPEKRAEISRRAAQTRMAREGIDAFRRMGKLGAKVRHGISPAEEKAIAQKAAAKRLSHNPEAFREMGMKGAERRHAKSAEEERFIAEKAAATRKQRNPRAFAEMGRRGGEQAQARRQRHSNLVVTASF